MYGIACEMVTGNAPQDMIPPYNLLHYTDQGSRKAEMVTKLRATCGGQLVIRNDLI
jgi:hypothetical protein